MAFLSVRFGDCELDAASHELRRSGGAVHLTPKAFRLLQLLVEQRPGVVSKDEIMATLWPGVFVSEANVPNLISEIRDAIGDRGDESRFIRTVHRLGYSFCGDVQVRGPEAVRDLEGPAAFSIILGAREIPLEDGDNLLGRGRGCHVLIGSHTVSRHHARIRVASGRAVLEDLGSKNGTFVCGRPAKGAVHLAHDDEIRLGAVSVRFRVLDEARQTDTYASRGATQPAPRRRRS